MGNMPTANYYAQLWFSNYYTLEAAVLQDDHTSWFDFELGITGSTLSDGNIIDTRHDTIIRVTDYLENGTIEYYRTIETNDTTQAAKMFPSLVNLGFLFIPIRPINQTTLERVQREASYRFLRDSVLSYRDRTGHRGFGPEKYQEAILQNLRVSSPMSNLFFDDLKEVSNSDSLMRRLQSLEPGQELALSRNRVMSLPSGALHGFFTQEDPVTRVVRVMKAR